MKKKSFAWCILLLLTALFSACKKNEVKLSADINSIRLNHCTSNLVLPYICFDSLLEDCRCPIGAVCIWQGTALIEVSFHEAAYTHRLIMSLKDFPGLGYPGDTTINGYTIIFTGLKPYPSINGSGDEPPTALFSLTH